MELNIFYEEPDPDRWFKFDRYPRKLIRRLVRGKTRPGGVMLVALELMRGLERIGVKFRFNDYKYAASHPDKLVCIIGKPQLLFEKQWKNPIIFGAGVYSHPIDCPNLFGIYPNVKRFLVPGEWMRKMCEPYYGHKVLTWPVGIDTEKWKPFNEPKTIDFLIYNKIRWEYENYETNLLQPIRDYLTGNNLTFTEIRYGSYGHDELIQKLTVSRAVIFICEHETQGLAYQQILSTGTPIYAWDRGGYWQDPSYYPHKVKYKEVSSVPYWDDTCGLKFKDLDEFEKKINQFVESIGDFDPRSYILKNLTLEKSAQHYISIVQQVLDENSSNS